MSRSNSQQPVTDSTKSARPPAWIVGQHALREFREAVEIVRETADTTCFPNLASACAAADESSARPSVIVIVQSRPGEIAQTEVERLRQRLPLAGIVALVGTWCEGELRTGRPLAGVTRLYWYEFPVWWQRQLARRAVGLRPEWTGAIDCGLRIADCGLSASEFRTPHSSIRNPKSEIRNPGPVVVAAPWWDSFDVISDVLRCAGYETVWDKPGRPCDVAQAVVAGIWEGAQLDEREEPILSEFCQQLAQHAAPVLAILDFPRIDRCDRALSLGAAAVLGKPWHNADLVHTLQLSIARNNLSPQSVRTDWAA